MTRSHMKRPRKAKKLPVVKPTRLMAYQWASTDSGGPIEELQRYLDAGWKVSKHRAQRAKNVPRSTILLEIPRDTHRLMVQADIDRAKELMRQANNLVGRGKGQGGKWHLINVTSEAYDRVAPTAPSVTVPLTIMFVVPPDWQDTASALKLTPAEYARRRIMMARAILAPAKETCQDQDVTYEPCELTLTRKYT